MKVNRVNVQNATSLRNSKPGVSFGINPMVTALDMSAGQITRGVKKAAEEAAEVAKSNDFFAKTLVPLGKSTGEIQNALINAVGTAFVAPIFIANNPISKEDKDTKKYSAWRQPISAVIALATQLPVNIAFENWMNNNATLGFFKDEDWSDLKNVKIGTHNINLDAKPQASYLKKLIKSANPYISPKELEERVIAAQDVAFDNELRRLRDMEAFNPGSSGNYESLISAKDYRSTVAKLKKDKSLIEEFAKQKLSHKEKEAKIKTMAMEQLTAKVKKDINLEVEKKFRIAQLLQKHESNVEKISEDVEAQLKKLESSETLDAFEKQVLDAVKEKIKKRSGEIIESKYVKKDTAGKIIGIVDKEEIFRRIRIKKFLNVLVDKSETVLKHNKTVAGIFVSLATLPVSCGILNWAYPRIMERIMPNLAAKKKAKEAK